MAHAYTPGLKVTEADIVTKERLLPLNGEVIVNVGDKVKATDIVARTYLPGKVQLVNVANKLSLMPAEVKEAMLKKEGEKIKKGEPIAQTKFLFFFTSTVNAPCDGSIESVSDVTGQVILREPPIPVEIKAYIDGTIKEVIPERGVVIETMATFIQGIFGIGKEAYGEIKVACKDNTQPLTDDLINDDMKEKIIVGGSLVTSEAINKAIQVGAIGIIAGGLNDKDLKEFLGYDLGVAITGNEEKGLTLIVTEGFGKIAMAERTFKLLKKNEGKKASINGATQIRAGVIRPEIIIPFKSDKPIKKDEHELQMGMTVGSPVRIIREPHFGKIAKVVNLPVELQQLESETKVRVVEVEFENGEKFTLPRANVETIET